MGIGLIDNVYEKTIAVKPENQKKDLTALTLSNGLTG